MMIIKKELTTSTLITTIQQKQPLKRTRRRTFAQTINIVQNENINLLKLKSSLSSTANKKAPILYSLLISLMSLFYKVIGAPKCQKLKNRLGLKIKPLTKTKEPFYSPGDSVIYECETNETKQTIKCLDDGKWSELPPCPDPSNNTCPSLEPMKHGYFNATGPYKVNTVVVFRCENEVLNYQETTSNNNPTVNSKRKAKELKEDATTTIINGSNQLSSENQKYTIPPPTTINANFNEVDAIPFTTTTISATNNQQSSSQSVSKSELPKPITLLPPSIKIYDTNGKLIFQNNTLVGSFENPITSSPYKYNLTGYRILKCLPSSKWNHEQPKCVQLIPEYGSVSSILLTSAIIILLPVFIFFLIGQLFLRWRKRQQQRERWKQYFTDYKYRHSKTSITFGMRPNQNSSNATIPVTDL